MRDVINFIKDNTILSHNDYVVIGLSGGPDSMALLDILLEYRKEVKFNIVCAHVHHNIRKESDDEALFVENYCLENDVIFEMIKLDYNGNFTESLGHKLRYDFFNKIINKYNSKYLFTAHHGDDLVETILMRIVRGSSLNGYSGFESISKRDSYTILRPLVSVSKEEILKYLEDGNIPYVIDNSNNDTCYTRNRYRKYILPKLKEEEENVHLKFLKFSNMLNELNEFISHYVDNIYQDIVQNNNIDIVKLKRCEHIIQLEIINRWLYNHYQDNILLVNDKHVDNIINMINNVKPNLTINIPNYQVIKSYDKLYIKQIYISSEYEYIIDKEISLPNGKIIKKVDISNMTSNYVTYLNSNDIKLPLYVRNYRLGDKMTIKNMKGHKKIKDIFINEKINLQERYNYPVVCDSNGEIVWLPGIKKSRFDIQNNTKCDIILEYH